MKSFYTLFVFVISIACAFSQYCGSPCDPTKKPSKKLEAPLKLIAVQDLNNEAIKYQIGGKVEIVDDCHFTVRDFYLYPPTAAAKWFGAKIGSEQGVNLSTEEVPPVDPNSPIEKTYDVSELQFCKASLLEDAQVFRLLDNNYQLIAEAIVNPNGEPSSNSNSNTNSTATGNKTSDATTSKWSIGLLAASALVALILA